MFSTAVMDRFLNPRNVGPLEGATHEGVAGSPGDGPYMQFWLIVEGVLICKAAYNTYGCPGASASGSLLAEIVSNRAVEQAQRVEPGDLLKLLGGLPEGREHCAVLAIDAFRNALREE